MYTSVQNNSSEFEFEKDTSTSSEDNPPKRAYLLESIVSKMLTHRDNHDPETVKRVKLAFKNGIFRDAGLDAPARAWLDAASNYNNGSIFFETVECAEFGYAASGSKDHCDFFDVLCKSKSNKIRQAAERALHRRRLAEQDISGALLAMNGTLRGQHTSLLE